MSHSRKLIFQKCECIDFDISFRLLNVDVHDHGIIQTLTIVDETLSATTSSPFEFLLFNCLGTVVHEYSFNHFY